MHLTHQAAIVCVCYVGEFFTHLRSIQHPWTFKLQNGVKIIGGFLVPERLCERELYTSLFFRLFVRLFVHPQILGYSIPNARDGWG